MRESAKGFLKSKLFWFVVIFVLMVRFFAPLIVLRELNKYLADFSPVYSGHVDSLGISFFRGAYQFRGFELRLKGSDQKNDRFVFGKVIDVSLAWREIFKGRVTTDIEVDRTEIILTQNVMNAFAKAPKEIKKDTREAADKLFPVRLERLDVKDSSFEFAELVSIPEASRWRITGIEGRASNVTPTEGAPLTFVTIKGALFGDAEIKVVAQVNQQIDPLAWDLDAELRNFGLSEANGWLKRKLPVTFTSGRLDLFAEARSLKGGMEGYVKPFFKNADVVANREAFVGLKHFGIEVSLATANLILRSSQEKTMATKIKFAYENGEFKLNSAQAVSEAFKNGFRDPLPEGIDDEISLSKEVTP